MKFSLYLGQYQGIKVFIHWTFSIILIWILIANARAGVALVDTAWSIFFILSLFFCVILHEFGYALTAKKRQRSYELMRIAAPEHQEDLEKSIFARF